MKVRCAKLLNPAGKLKSKSQWLTVGKTYHVLELFQDEGRWNLRLMGDEPNGLAVFRLDQFEIVSSKIPDTWIISFGESGFLHLKPALWTADFFVRFYDKEPDALHLFEGEMRKIIASDP